MKTFLFLFFIMVGLSGESLHQPYDTIGNRQECVGVSVSRDDDLKDYGHWLKEWSDFEEKMGYVCGIRPMIFCMLNIALL